MAPAPNPDDTQPVVPLDEAFLPPPSRSGDADPVRLELRVEELERRLKARTLELETEIRGKERLRSRIEELTRRIAELEETAACLHREAVSATALCQELEETLRVASEARRHLGSALEAEKGRREAAEKDLAGVRDAKRMVQAARQKIDGHEAHIESLRSELAEARQRHLEAETGRAELESRALAAEEKARSVMQNAEEIRREGVEAFEKAREAALGLQLQEDKFRRESAGLAALKAEIRARAERELTEMRRSLDAERARMHLDLEAESRGASALGRGAEAPSGRFERLHAESEERRREISREAQEYAASAPPAPARLPVEGSDTEPPSSREPWQVSDELRLVFWVSLAVGLLAAMVASVLFLQR